LLYRVACGSWRVDPVKAELGPSAWRLDVANWLSRARRGVGVTGRYGSSTAFFWGEHSWGGSLAGACYRPREENRDRGNGNGHGNDKKGKKPPPPEATPTPPPPPP
jgi:hypothetical protein